MKTNAELFLEHYGFHPNDNIHQSTIQFLRENDISSPEALCDVAIIDLIIYYLSEA